MADRVYIKNGCLMQTAKNIITYKLMVPEARSAMRAMAARPKITAIAVINPPNFERFEFFFI